MNYIKSSENTSWMLNIDINSQPTPDIFRPWNSRLAVKPLSKLSSSIQYNPPRSFPRNSLDRMRSLHDQARTLSLYDFQIVDTRFRTRIHFQTHYGIPHQVPCQTWPSVKAFLTLAFLSSHFFMFKVNSIFYLFSQGHIHILRLYLQLTLFFHLMILLWLFFQLSLLGFSLPLLFFNFF